MSEMLKTSESAGVKHAERHPVGGVVLTITLEDEYVQAAGAHYCILCMEHVEPGLDPVEPKLHVALIPVGLSYGTE